MAGSKIGLALLVVALAAGTDEARAAHGSADLEWAQQVLKDKGFDVGRPNGEMTPKTRAAIQSFQRISGLPVTGDLDGGTTAKLLAGRPEPAGGGQLGLPPAGHSHPAAEAAPTARPHAAPTTRIDATGGASGEALIGSAGSGGASSAPRAAPSGAVAAGAVAPLTGQATAPDAGDSAVPSVVQTAAWVRDAVVGVIVAILGGFAVLWWWSGRRPAPARPLTTSAPRERREPSFAPASRPRGGRELRVQRL